MKKINYIVHIGAGIGSELFDYLKFEPEHIYLYEGGAKSYQVLEKKVKPYKNVSAFNQVVTVEGDGVSSFYTTKPAQFSGLGPPECFREKLKNVGVQLVEEVENFPLSSLTNRHPELVDKNKQSVLVLQLNGFEDQLLMSADLELLSTFSAIEVQLPKSCIDDASGSPSSDVGMARLIEFGFDLVEDASQKQDPLYIYYNLVKKEQKIERWQFKQQIITLEKENHMLLQEKQQLRQEFDACTASNIYCKEQLQGAIEEKEKFAIKCKKLSQANLAMEALNKQHEQDVRGQLEEKKVLTIGLDEREQRIKVLTSELEFKNKELDKNTSEVKELKKSKQNILKEHEQKIKIQFKEKEVLIAEIEQRSKLQINELENKLAEFKQLDESKKLLISQTEKQLSKLVEEKESADAISSKREKKFKLMEDELLQQAAELHRLAFEHEEWKKNKKSLQAKHELEIEKSSSETLRLKKNLEIKTKELKTEKEEGQELKRSERMTQKMLVKAQVDLEDLRTKYSIKKGNEKELIQLIQELREKLTLASEYYLKIKKKYPNILSNTVLSSDEQSSDVG